MSLYKGIAPLCEATQEASLFAFLLIISREEPFKYSIIIAAVNASPAPTVSLTLQGCAFSRWDESLSTRRLPLSPLVRHTKVNLNLSIK